MSVIREDVVQIEFDIQENPFQELINEINQMKRAILGATDDGEDGLQDIVNTTKQATSGLNDLAQEARKAGNANLSGLNQSVKEVTTDMNNLTNTTKQAGNTNMNGFKQSVQETVRETKQMNITLTTLIRNTAILSKMKLSTAFQSLKAVPRTIFNKITGGLHKMKNGFASIKNMSFKKLLSSLNQIAGRGLLKGTQGAKRLWTGLKQAASVSFLYVKSQVTALIPKMKQLGIAAMKTFGRGLKKSIAGISAGIKRLNQMTKTALLGLGTGLIAGASAAYRFGSAYETSLKKTTTLLDQNKLNVNDLNTQVMDLSNRTGEDAAGLQESVYQALSAGADASKVTNLVETAVKAAKGGFTDTTTAIDGLTSTLNTYGMKTAQADSVANSFLITQNKGKTTFGELASSIGGVAPTANAAGVGVNDLLASVASLTANGIATSEAMTGIKAALSNVIKVTPQAAKIAKKLGIDFSTSAIKSKGWTKFLDEIKIKTGGNSETMAQLFGSTEALNAMLTLTSKQGSKLMNDTLSEMSTNTTALDDAYKTMTDTAEVSVQKGVNSFKNLGIAIYQGNQGLFADITSEFANIGNELYTAFQEGGIEALPSKIATILSDITVRILQNAPKLLEVGIHFLDLFISGIINNKDSVADSGTKIITTLVEGLSKYYSKFLSCGITIITNILKGLAKEAPRLVQVMVTSLKDLLKNIRKNSNEFMESGIKIIMELIRGLVQSTPDIIQTAVVLINGLLQGIQQNLPEIVNSAIYIVFSLIQGIIQVLPMLLTVGLQLILALDMGILQNLPQLMVMAFQIVETLWITIIDSLPQIVELGAQLIISFIQGIVLYIPMLLKTAWNLVKELFSVLTDINTWKEVGSNIISNIKDGIANGIKSLFGGGKEAAEETKNGFTSGMSDFTFDMPIDDTDLFSNGHSGGQRYFDGMNAGMTGTELTAPNIDTSSYYQTGQQGVQKLNKGIEDELSKNKPRMSTDIGVEKLGIQSVDTTGVQKSFQQVTSASNQMQTDVSSSVQTVNQATSELSKNTGFSDLSKSAKKSMKSIHTSTTKGMNQMRSTVARGLNGVVNNFRSSMGSVKSIVMSTNLYTTGQNIVSGLINGINSKKQQLIDTAKEMGNAIEKATNTELKIHSPSRVMKQTGANVVLGTKIGMEDTFGELRKTSQNMGQTVKKDTDKEVSPQAKYRPSNTRSVQTNNSSSNFVYSPTIPITVNGSVDKQSEFKLRKMMKEILKEDKEQMKRLYPRLREV